VDPFAGVDGASESATSDGAQRALDSEGATIEVALAPGQLPARRPDLVLRQPRQPLLLLVQSARPAQPLPCASTNLAASATGNPVSQIQATTAANANPRRAQDNIVIQCT
jgi:hypothetical protein